MHQEVLSLTQNIHYRGRKAAESRVILIKSPQRMGQCYGLSFGASSDTYLSEISSISQQQRGQGGIPNHDYFTRTTRAYSNQICKGDCNMDQAWMPRFMVFDCDFVLF